MALSSAALGGARRWPRRPPRRRPSGPPPGWARTSGAPRPSGDAGASWAAGRRSAEACGSAACCLGVQHLEDDGARRRRLGEGPPTGASRTAASEPSSAKAYVTASSSRPSVDARSTTDAPAARSEAPRGPRRTRRAARRLGASARAASPLRTVRNVRLGARRARVAPRGGPRARARPTETHGECGRKRRLAVTAGATWTC